jgi:hypothetical protein
VDSDENLSPQKTRKRKEGEDGSLSPSPTKKMRSSSDEEETSDGSEYEF